MKTKVVYLLKKDSTLISTYVDKQEAQEALNKFKRKLPECKFEIIKKKI